VAEWVIRRRIAPDPGALQTVVEKKNAVDRAFKGWQADQIKGMGKPFLLVAGDSDLVRPEHEVEVFRLLGGGVFGDIAGLPDSQLAILPGTTHVTLVHKADWLVSMISQFLSR
jgi:pimeloyl-ACP methyl ester carboxylesterase